MKKLAKYKGFLLFCVGIAMIGMGILRSEHMTVFQKAATICLECIGIG